MLMNDPEGLYRAQRTQHAIDIENGAAARARRRSRQAARRAQGVAARQDIARGWESLRSLARHLVAYAQSASPAQRVRH